jgi:hypothetical protein
MGACKLSIQLNGESFRNKKFIDGKLSEWALRFKIRGAF